MENSKKTFAKNLDQLMNLFGKLRGKIMNDEIPGIDKGLLENFEVVVENYTSVKESVPDELLDIFGDSIQDMVEHMVKKLEGELENEYDEYEQLYYNNTDPENVTVSEIERMQAEFETIDMLLKDPDLTVAEIDRFLDERSKIVKK